ncbi:hypothetical protein DBR33_02765, partial [Stenotrophomonas sp. HMWF022]
PVAEQKAAWARARAAELWGHVSALEATVGGDWQARARRRRAADRLIREAGYFERMATKLEGPDFLEVELPF